MTSTPPAGWYRDPADAGRLRFWDGRQWGPQIAPLPPDGLYPPAIPALDATIAAMRAENAQPWGWRPIVAPILAVIALIAASQFAVRLEPDHGSGRVVFVVVANLILEGAIVAALYLSGRRVAAAHGGWGRTFGWRRPRLADLPIAGLGFLISLGLRIGLGIVLYVVSHGRATRQAQNVHVSSANLPTVLLLVAVVVIAAPLTEELMFRGLLLRTFMQRWSFWPAAIASTVIFGLFHTYEVDTLLGAVTLALTVGAMGLVNCVLVRRTDRLMPGILVHAASNGLAVLILVLTVHNSAFGP